MRMIILVGFLILGLLDMVSTTREFFRWRAIESAAERRAIARRRMAIHLGFYAVLILGFFAIVYFGPLRPVHEWIR